ncbi:MAG: hypothetical protein IJV76_05720, partial [Clostridia bacterium]|nr:hypothetical protein [Clostridia bacterium]
MKKLLTLLLVSAMLLGSLASCGESTTNADETTPASGDTTVTEVEAVEEETELTHGLPEKNFTGADYVGLIRTSRITHFSAEEMTGEALNDSVYERNNTVSEEFG